MSALLQQILRLPLLIALTLGLLAGPIASNGYVWCVAADGQARLMTEDANGCCPDSAVSPTFRPPVVACETMATQCSPCFDVPVHSHWSSTRSRITNTQPVMFPPVPRFVAAGSTVGDARELPDGLSPEPSPRVPELILHHRTIVLLV